MLIKCMHTVLAKLTIDYQVYKYQFVVTYKDRKHMLVKTLYTQIKSNLQYTVDKETVDVPSFISYTKPIHLSIILG